MGETNKEKMNTTTFDGVIRRWGNSLGMIIPSNVVNNLDLEEGDIVNTEISTLSNLIAIQCPQCSYVNIVKINTDIVDCVNCDFEGDINKYKDLNEEIDGYE